MVWDFSTHIFKLFWDLEDKNFSHSSSSPKELPPMVLSCRKRSEESVSPWHIPRFLAMLSCSTAEESTPRRKVRTWTKPKEEAHGMNDRVFWLKEEYRGQGQVNMLAWGDGSESYFQSQFSVGCHAAWGWLRCLGAAGPCLLQRSCLQQSPQPGAAP